MNTAAGGGRWAARLGFAGPPRRMTRRLAGAVLGAQAVVVVFFAAGARALAAAGGAGGGSSSLLVGLALAVALVLAAGLLRRRVGVPLGWACQVATLLCAVVVPVMVVIGLIFGALWVVALWQGDRMDDLTEAYVREHPQETARP